MEATPARDPRLAGKRRPPRSSIWAPREVDWPAADLDLVAQELATRLALATV